VAKYLRVTERSVWRWLADDSAPYAVLAALWHETPKGREAAALDVGNELTLTRGLARSSGALLSAESARLARVLAISDTGAANEPLLAGPVAYQRNHSQTKPAAMQATTISAMPSGSIISACETGR
jgi:hypothetical protein